MPITSVTLAAAALAACGGAPPPPAASPSAATTLMPGAPTVSATPQPVIQTRLPTASVSMDDAGCQYSGPAVLGAGTVILGLENQSTGQFDADLWLLHQGHGYDELAAHIAKEQELAEAGKPGLGHPSFATLVAETSLLARQGTLTAGLAPGTYGLACIRFVGGSPVDIWAAGPFTTID